VDIENAILHIEAELVCSLVTHKTYSGENQFGAYNLEVGSKCILLHPFCFTGCSDLFVLFCAK
jgi:hypothetical protein